MAFELVSPFKPAGDQPRASGPSTPISTSRYSSASLPAPRTLTPELRRWLERGAASGVVPKA